MGNPPISKELRKGSADLLVLALLEDRPRHGYEIARLIGERSDGAINYHVASLYPTLYRLENHGFIEGRWVEKAGQRRRRYYRLVRRVLAAIPEAREGLLERLREHMAPLIERNPFFATRINMQVSFEVLGAHGGDWIVDFRPDGDKRVVYDANGQKCRYRFRFESRNIEQVLRGELSWEDLLLTLRFRAHRDPDQYNQHLFTFFKMADHAALQAIAYA